MDVNAQREECDVKIPVGKNNTRLPAFRPSPSPTPPRHYAFRCTEQARFEIRPRYTKVKRKKKEGTNEKTKEEDYGEIAGMHRGLRRGMSSRFYFDFLTRAISLSLFLAEMKNGIFSKCHNDLQPKAMRAIHGSAMYVSSYLSYEISSISYETLGCSLNAETAMSLD